MSSIPQGRGYNDTHRDTTSLAWLSICKQTEKDHNNPSSGCTDRSRSVSGEGADNRKHPPGSGAAKSPEPGRSDQPKYTTESATEILSRFGLDKDDLGELNAYSEDQITPENLKYVLMQISIKKKERAAEKSSESQPTIGLKSDLHKTPVKSNKVIDCGDFGSSVAKKETEKDSTDKSRGKSLVETHKPSEDRLQRCVLKGKSRESEISEQNKMVSPKHKPDETKLYKPLSPKQPESTSKPSKAEQKSSNRKESKTRIKETTVAGQNKKSPEKKNPEVQTELKCGQQGQDKSVMQTKFKGSSFKNDSSCAIVSSKQKPDEPKPCKPLPPKQPESTSKSSKPGKAEQKSSNSKESKTQIKETTVAGQNKAELKQGQQGRDKSVIQTKFKGSSCKNEPSHAIIRDCKGISPESFPHYCSICNKESRNVHAWCSHMKTTEHREKCKTLYPDLFCEQQFPRIDSTWRRCRETGKHKSDSRRRNASHSRSQERHHRRGSSSRSPCRRNASRSRSRSHGRRHRRGSSSRSHSPYRQRRKSRSRSTSTSDSSSSEDRRDRCRSPSRSSYSYRQTHRSQSRSPRYEKSTSCLPSPGMPSERQLSPKNSSKNPPSPSRSGEKQTSGETSVPQDENSAETLVKKLLQSSAVQSLSKQIDVESLVKTLTPVFLDEFNKLTSTPGSSEAPQTKSTASSPPNHEEVGAETLRSADGSGRSGPVLEQSVNAAASGNLEEKEQEVTSTRKRGRPRKKARNTLVRKSAGVKHESSEENREEEGTKSLPGASLDSSSALLGDVKTETDAEAAEVLDQSVNAAAAGDLEEMEEKEREVTSIRKGGRPRKKPRKTPVRKSARGKPENPEENREEDKSLPCASLDPSSSALLGDVKTEMDNETAEVLDQSVNAVAAGELEETEQTEQEVTSIIKRGRPRKKSRKTPVRKSAGGKRENPEENREEEDQSLPGASLDPSSSALLGAVKTETDNETAEAAGDLEEMKDTEQEVASTKKRGRSGKKPRKAPVRKSAGGKPENPEEETKSLPETEAECPDRQNLDGRLEEEEEDEGRCKADGEGLEEETVPLGSVLDQSVNAAAAGNLEEMEDTEQEVTSTRKRGRPRKKPRKTPVRKSAGGKPENPEENREEEDKSLPGASLDPSSSALLGDVKTESDDEAAEGPDKKNLDGRLEEEEEEDEEVACKKRRKSPCTAADFILPPFNTDISFGEEFTARKLGYYCSLCSVFYMLKSNEEDTHCCSRNHYDNLLKHSQMKEEEPSPPPKRKTRSSR